MKNYFDLSGKVALITGASSGLGVQFAKALASQGATIVIAARRVEKLEAIKGELIASGAKCLAVKCDVSNSEEVKAMVAAAVEAYGRIDILINNAGVASSVRTTDMSDEEWLRVVNINLNGVFYTGREVAKVMVKQNYGKIINVGSIHSEVALTPLAGSLGPYCATKGAVKMLTKEWAVEWAKNNITVNAVAPSYFSSEMTQEFIDGPMTPVIQAFCPMGRVGAEGELNGAVIYFASDASSFTTGQILAVDGGWTCL
ncbi:MAG: glucose 1-dehydrogenase [Erysipelotrichaceae bacterium]